jgi:urease accessory protein
MRTTRTASAIFAANRAQGKVAFDVRLQDGVTRRGRLHESGSLRVRFPSPEAEGLSAVLVNTAGGVAGGDRHDLEISVGQGASLAVTTAAAEKIYRAIGTDAEIAVKLSVGEDARLAWLPQETILFDRARLKRSIEVHLAPNASLLMAEAIIFGRSAMDEAVEQGALTDRWRIRRDGKLIFAETVRFDGAIRQVLSEPAVAAGGVAIATALAVPGDQNMVERVRAQTFSGEGGVSAWNGLAVARLCAKDGASLRRDLAAVIVAMGGALPRLWLN